MFAHVDRRAGGTDPGADLIGEEGDLHHQAANITRPMKPDLAEACGPAVEQKPQDQTDQNGVEDEHQTATRAGPPTATGLALARRVVVGVTTRDSDCDAR